MGSQGDAYDSAAESFMATVKAELVKRRTFKTRDQARFEEVFRYVERVDNPHR
jgi:hypothetical protein